MTPSDESRLLRIETKLDTVVDWMNQQKGGKKWLITTIASAGALGAFVQAVFFSLINSHPSPP